jgi:2-dehydro-3-deoxygluconokinase
MAQSSSPTSPFPTDPLARGHVTCFGELLLRLSPPAPRLFAQSDTAEISVAGAEGNVAAGLAMLGHLVRFCGLVAD